MIKTCADFFNDVYVHKIEVPFIGHVASGDGLKIHPDKVQAILEMPDPGDAAAIPRLIGMVTYLAKFVPRLSDITEPLRELIRHDTEWVWDHPQEKAFQKLKEAVLCAPVLRYSSLEDGVTMQCGCILVWIGCSTNPVRAASSICVPYFDTSRDSVCTNREGVASHSL